MRKERKVEEKAERRMAEYAASTASSTSTGKDALESGNPMRGGMSRQRTSQDSNGTRRRDFGLALRQFGRDDRIVDRLPEPEVNIDNGGNEGHWRRRGTLRRLGDLVQAGRLLGGGLKSPVIPVSSIEHARSKHVLKALDMFYHTDRESILQGRKESELPPSRNKKRQHD